MQKRYIALRIISWILRILAVLLIFGGMCGGIALVLIAPPLPLFDTTETSSQIFARIITGMGVAITTWFSALMLYGAGEFLMLAVDVEENTRLAATALQRLAKLP